MLGMAARLAVEVVAYERRIDRDDDLHMLCCALSRLAEHLRQERRRAA